MISGVLKNYVERAAGWIAAALVVAVAISGCGTPEDQPRQLTISVVKHLLRELPHMRFTFERERSEGSSGAIRGRVVGPQGQAAVFEVSFVDKDSAEVRVGHFSDPYSGIGGEYPGGRWGVDYKELNFRRHRPRVGMFAAAEKLCRWTTGEACPP
jgi:hypothetical protein